MKKFLFVALIAASAVTSNAFGLFGGGRCGACPTRCERPVRSACPAPACTVDYQTAEQPTCVKMVPSYAPAECHKEIITTFTCPVGYEEA